MDDDNVVVVTDTDPEKRQQEYINTEVSNLLWTGIVIGFGLCICLFGLVQQLVDLLNTNDDYRELIQHYWFQLKWWYWLGPLAAFIVMYRLARSGGKKRLLKDARNQR